MYLLMCFIIIFLLFNHSKIKERSKIILYPLNPTKTIVLFFIFHNIKIFSYLKRGNKIIFKKIVAALFLRLRNVNLSYNLPSRNQKNNEELIQYLC